MAQQLKKEMRSEIKRVLANLDRRWQFAANAEVCGRIIEVIERRDGDPVTDVLAWVPSFQGEVDLAAVIARMLGTRRVYLPRVVGAGRMEFIQIDASWANNLEQGDRGVIQPRPDYGEVLDGANLGRLAVLVPGLAFDLHGARLGRGGGFYDRFLAGLRIKSAVKIGVCWSMQIVPAVPTDIHDVRVDWICHEDEAIRIV